MNGVYLEDNEFVMPVGFVDESGNVHKTVKLRPMTGETEEAISDVKVRENGGKIVTELLYSVVESIGTLPKVTRDMIRDLTIADRDFLLLMNRKYSIGSDVKYIEPCPSCRTRNEISVNINDIPVTRMDDKDAKELTFDLPIGYRDPSGTVHKTIVVSQATGRVQERIATLVRSNPAQATTLMLTLITRKLGSLEYTNPDIFKAMTKKDRDEITHRVSEVEVGAKLSIEAVCAECGHEYSSYLPVQSLMGE